MKVLRRAPRPLAPVLGPQRKAEIIANWKQIEDARKRMVVSIADLAKLGWYPWLQNGLPKARKGKSLAVLLKVEDTEMLKERLFPQNNGHAITATVPPAGPIAQPAIVQRLANGERLVYSPEQP